MLNRTPRMFSSQSTLFGCPLESSDNRVLNLVQVLDTLGAVDQNVGSIGVRAEAPDLPGFGDVVLVLVSQVTATELEVLLVADLALVNVLGQTIRHGNGPHEKSVMLVGRFAQAHYIRFF